MKIVHTTLLALAISATGAAFAAGFDADTEKLLQSKGCLACHTVDKKLVGPSYKDVAAKYAGDKKAVDTLSAKVIKGGSGVWGPIPMPPNATVKPEEAKALVTAILKVK